MTDALPLLPSQAQDRYLPAFVLALGLHLAVVAVLPHLDRLPSPPPLRIEIDLTRPSPQPAEAVPANPEPPQPQPPQPPPKRVVPREIPQPRQHALPLLAARDEIPAPQDYAVADTPAPTEPIPVEPAAPVSAPAVSDTAEAVAGAANAAPASSTEANPAEAWEGYGQLLYDMVSRNKNYPQMAIRRHWEGKVKVSARFSMGKLVELALLPPGSGHQVLDSAALEMLRKAVNALPVRGDLMNKSFTVVVPVDFKLEG